MSGRIDQTRRTGWKRVLIPAAITFLAFSVELDNPGIGGAALRVLVLNLIGSFRGFRIADAVLLPCLVLLYWFMESRAGKPERRDWTVKVLSVLFALFMVLGYSFEKDDSWQLVLTVRNGQILKAALCFWGYRLFFERVLHGLFFVLDRFCSAVPETLPAERDGRRLGRYGRRLEEKPFRTVFLTLLLAYTPHILLSYPAIFMGDNRAQIVQAFPVLGSVGGSYMSGARLLSESVFINQHHPILHTWLIHGCLLLGNALFHSFNAGAFLCALVHALSLIAAYSGASAFLLRERIIRTEHALLLIAYAFVHPLIHNYLCLLTKDVLLAAVLILLVWAFYLLLTGRRGGKTYMFMALACVGMLLLRNDWKYLLPLALLAAGLLQRPTRKVFLAFGCFALFTGFAVYGLLFPALRYTPGSVREMLSIPFQQTARYVAYHADDVTDGEREAIDAVLDYASLKENYNPDKSDAVKKTYREEAAGKELLRYFRAWAAMLWKHPGTYVQATMNNYYQYFYPGVRFRYNYSYRWSETCIEDTNKAIKALGQAFSYPESTAGFRSASDRIYVAIRSFPGFSLLMTPAVYTWLMLIMLFYGIRRRKTAALALLAPPLGTLLMCVLGPCNGYYGRYQFPAVVLMPILIPLFLACCRREGDRREEAGEP